MKDNATNTQCIMYSKEIEAEMIGRFSWAKIGQCVFWASLVVPLNSACGSCSSPNQGYHNDECITVPPTLLAICNTMSTVSLAI